MYASGSRLRSLSRINADLPVPSGRQKKRARLRKARTNLQLDERHFLSPSAVYSAYYEKFAMLADTSLTAVAHKHDMVLVWHEQIKKIAEARGLNSRHKEG